MRHLAHIWQRFTHWWSDPYQPQPNWSEKVVVLLTAVVAGVGLLQWSVYRQQKAIMESSGAQTDQLIKAANIQAGAASRNAESASISAQAASDLAGATKNIAERALSQTTAANALAGQSKRSADIAQAGLEAQERPWIGYDHINIPEKVVVGSTVKNSLVYKNWGKGPALHVESAYQINLFCDKFPIHPPFDVEGIPSALALMPNQIIQTGTTHFKVPLTMEVLDKIKSPTCGLYLYGRITYRDTAARKHWRHWCGKWVITTDDSFETCSSYNDGDEDYEKGKEP